LTTILPALAAAGIARRRRLLPTAADPFFMGQHQGRSY
jgi:hypothetical protein